jgi:S-adenosylmethionine:tRNA ribosyltransferase-isomerase
VHIDSFDFFLPEELIAQEPLANRDASRLLVLDRQSGRISHRGFTDIVNYLTPLDALVLNDTRVIPARLAGVRAGSRGTAEVLLLRRTEKDTWEALVRPGRRLRSGAEIVFGDGRLKCRVTAELPEGIRLLRFQYCGIFEEVLDELGEAPLPPYIRKKLADRQRYQTVYAREDGSAAAPTAGLHFTPALLEKIKESGVSLVYLTLHVGLGTFRPVKAADIREHKMHSEFYRLEAEAARTLTRRREAGGRIVAVGTTSCRVLETLAAADGEIRPGSGWTDIFIYPGHRFHGVDALLTNFHLPRSTLLMLVSALAGGENILNAYREAVRERYRFFSFGDAMLIL